ncbi:MAG: AMP-binding protein [Acidobacteriota bacterium]|nr:AMP-binding protein [Acidobacteriota bacterium]
MTTSAAVHVTAQQSFKAARDVLLRHRADYHTACAEFQWPVLHEFNWALDWFDAIARGERRNQTALWVMHENGGEDRLTFAELSHRSSQIANYLRSLGVRRGDRIMLMLSNVPQLWEAILAAMKLGAVVIPTTTLLTADDIADRSQRGQVRHIIASADLAARFDHIQALSRVAVGGEAPAGWVPFEDGYHCSGDFESEGVTRAGDPLQLYFTSGTTSKPKMVLHTHASYPAGHLSTMYWIGLQPGDVHCNLSSPGWAKHAWSCVFAPWNAEATVFAYNQARFHAAGLLNALVKAKATTFCAPPTVWRMLAQEDLASYKVSLREAVSAGEPLNPEVIERVQAAWGITIRDGYGQTETTAQLGNSPGQPLKLGSVGRPMPGYRLTLLDIEDNETDEGELCIRLDPPPLALMPGYQDDLGNVQYLTGQIYRTGDVMSRDSDGYYTFVGRADDVFKASDYRISPFELESALVEHPDVVECAVVPSPDPIRTAIPKAFVILRAGLEPSRELALSIFQHIRRVLAPYKRIRRIEFSDLPKTISGKIRRVQLRRAEAESVANGQRAQREYREEDFPELK